MSGRGMEHSHQAPVGTAKANDTVKVEPYNGSYECFICNHSVRPQLKQALAAGNNAGGNGVADEANLVLKCPRCTGEVYHAACGGAEFRTLCSTCGQETVQQWSPWGPPQGGIAAGQAVVVDDDSEATAGDGTHQAPAEPATSAKPKFLPFQTALLYARSLKLKTMREWQALSKSGARPANIPSSPDKYYAHDGWQGFGHWLGTGAVAPQNQKFLPFKKALLHAGSLKLNTTMDWVQWCKSSARPAKLPTAPDRTYKHDGWQGYGHWLGTGNVGVKKDQQFLPFKKALLYARSLKLKNQTEWQVWRTTGARPANVPSAPDLMYKHDGWQGWGHWLGTV